MYLHSDPYLNYLFQRFSRLDPITEDKEGEEIAGENTPRVQSGISRSRRSSVAPIVIRNRLQQRLTRKDLYFKAIQELLEIGDAYRVVKNAMSTISEDSDDEDFEDSDDDLFGNSLFPTKLKQRKMSSYGLLEQSAAERSGFAALLTHKLNLLLMEDDIEQDASFVNNNDYFTRRFSSESAPASLHYIKGSNLQKYSYYGIFFLF